MARTLNEVRTFTKEDLAEIAKNVAKLEIIGDIYRGEFHTQEIIYQSDGSLMIITSHTPEKE